MDRCTRVDGCTDCVNVGGVGLWVNVDSTPSR